MKKQNQTKMTRPETKQQRIAEEIRREHLEEAIEKEYENTTIESVEALAARYEDSMVEMFQVVKKKKNNLTLEHFFQEGEYYDPVRASPNLAQYINVGDVFLLTMAWDGEAWDILLMSSPYETMSL